jgi:GDPmannose 4,6-dehydratase
LSNKLSLGNLEAKRDWGHAKDYIVGMWLMLQQEKPEDFVLATGISRSVKDLVNYVFNKLELDVEKYVVCEEKYMRPEELHYLKGDASKAREKLGWKTNYTFESMIDEMIDYWMNKIK